MIKKLINTLTVLTYRNFHYSNQPSFQMPNKNISHLNMGDMVIDTLRMEVHTDCKVCFESFQEPNTPVYP